MKAWLIEQGFDVPFLDFDKHAGIPPGANWEQTLYREIERSQALLIIQTANWSASRWCFAEFTQARALGKPIFQVIETADADPGDKIARDLQVLDLRRNREAGLQQLSEQLTALALSAQGGMAWDKSRPPYPGLLTFEQEDAPVYFGRDEGIRHLIERLTARRTLGLTRLLVLLGASGSGKSSLLRAGVLPRLRRAGRGWLVVPPFRPQNQPCQELAQVLALASDRPTQWRDLHQSLLLADQNGSLPALLSEIGSDLRMAAGSNDAQILLPIDQAEELFSSQDHQEVRRFYRILSAAMAGDLPFLAVMTLRSDFLGRLQAASADGLSARFEEVRRLTLAHYRALGDSRAHLSPLENAVSVRADAVLEALQPSQDQRRALREAFVPAMVRLEQGDYVRRPAAWDALPRPAWPLLEQLVNARLLITRQQEEQRLVEVAHEALLRKWPLLRGWLDEDREFLIGSQQLELDLQDWQRAPEAQRDAALLTGLKLQRAKAWLAERPRQLSPELRAFVQASAARADALQRRSRRQRRLLIGGLSSLCSVALVSGGIAWWREGQARAGDYSSRAELLLESDPINSMIYALAAIDHVSPSEAFETGQTLAAATGRNRQVASIPTGQGAVLTLLALRNGEVVSGGQDGSLRRWRNRQPVGEAIPTGQGRVRSLLQLRNGDLISGGEDGTLRRWRDGQAIGAAIRTGQTSIWSLLELSNGEWISGGADGSLRRWRDGQPIGQAIPTGQGGIRALVEVNSNDVVSAGEDGSLRRWHDGRPTGTPMITGQGKVNCLIRLVNGELISGGSDGSLRRWREGRAVGGPMPSGQGSLHSVIELDNGELVSGGSDGTLRRWRNGREAGPAVATGQHQVLSLVD
ncbi:MAG: TIR domain-containing protein, partial [Synechococcaceae bacterium WB4_1_0192]|nr:TIR domain-containing protein [Synechococcaceae bacterium WB4_1_0192]